MLGHSYFYNANLKKIVAVFGAIFNDISVAQKNGNNLTGVKRVPLAYAPREKYLARINADINQGVALKLPRMSFEITDISYDTISKLNRLNKTIQENANNDLIKVRQASPYNITFSLNILSRGQDEALQILEQILPHFNPNYTLSVKGLEGPDSITDVPITLQSVTFEDSYEGEFESSRRTIIYTLTFELKMKFSSPVKNAKLIKVVDVYFNDDSTNAVIDNAGVRAYVDETDDCPPNYISQTITGEAPDPNNVLWPETIVTNDGKIVFDGVTIELN